MTILPEKIYLTPIQYGEKIYIIINDGSQCKKNNACFYKNSLEVSNVSLRSENLVTHFGL